MSAPAYPCCGYRRSTDPARRHACSWWHAELVRSYRAERERQEAALEQLTGGYPADEQLHRDRAGARPVTFRDWLLAMAGSRA